MKLNLTVPWEPSCHKSTPTIIVAVAEFSFRNLSVSCFSYNVSAIARLSLAICYQYLCSPVYTKVVNLWFSDGFLAGNSQSYSEVAGKSSR